MSGIYTFLGMFFNFICFCFKYSGVLSWVYFRIFSFRRDNDKVKKRACLHRGKGVFSVRQFFYRDHIILHFFRYKSCEKLLVRFKLLMCFLLTFREIRQFSFYYLQLNKLNPKQMLQLTFIPVNAILKASIIIVILQYSFPCSIQLPIGKTALHKTAKQQICFPKYTR